MAPRWRAGVVVSGANGPIAAGWVAELTGDIASTYTLAAALLVAPVLLLPLYHRMAARASHLA